MHICVITFKPRLKSAAEHRAFFVGVRVSNPVFVSPTLFVHCRWDVLLKSTLMEDIHTCSSFLQNLKCIAMLSENNVWDTCSVHKSAWNDCPIFIIRIAIFQIRAVWSFYLFYVSLAVQCIFILNKLSETWHQTILVCGRIKVWVFVKMIM